MQEKLDMVGTRWLALEVKCHMETSLFEFELICYFLGF